VEVDVAGRRYAVVAFVPPRPAALATLTASEWEVVERWVEGDSMRAIARARGVTARTVAKQIASAYAKLKVSSRGELFQRLLVLAEQDE
jgi:DNA-binding CsgD family transcriptional regulator